MKEKNIKIEWEKKFAIHEGLDFDKKSRNDCIILKNWLLITWNLKLEKIRTHQLVAVDAWWKDEEKSLRRSLSVCET